MSSSTWLKINFSTRLLMFHRSKLHITSDVYIDAKWNDAKRTQEESRQCKEACREHKDAKALRCCLVCSIREAEGPKPSTEHSLHDRPQATAQGEQSR